jgi:DNA-binding GntR family transcriptional regulator
VRKIAVSAVTDARFVREAIEADIVRHLAENADETTISRLRGQIAEQRTCQEDSNRFMALDELFHATLASAAGKARVWKIVEGLKSQMDRVRHLSMLRFPIPKLVAQHAAIVDAIARHDADGAVLAMRGHLREILNDLPAIAEENPEYFEEQP